MLFEIRNQNLLYNGEFYKQGDVVDFDENDEIVKLRPDILFSLAEGNKLDNDVKIRNSKLLNYNKDLEEENVKLLYKVKQLEENNIELVKRLSEVMRQNKSNENTEAKEQLKRKYIKKN